MGRRGNRNGKTAGHTRLSISQGYIPHQSRKPEPQHARHKTTCLLNADDHNARVSIIISSKAPEPARPYRGTAPARPYSSFSLSNPSDPGRTPSHTDYTIKLISDVSTVVQHTRLDSPQTEHALLTAIACINPTF